jgi:hypothetical protein
VIRAPCIYYVFFDYCDLHKGMPFGCTIIEVETNPSTTKELLSKAYKILNESTPKPGENCEYCKWKEATFKD